MIYAIPRWDNLSFQIKIIKRYMTRAPFLLRLIEKSSLELIKAAECFILTEEHGNSARMIEIFRCLKQSVKI